MSEEKKCPPQIYNENDKFGEGILPSQFGNNGDHFHGEVAIDNGMKVKYEDNAGGGRRKKKMLNNRRKRKYVIVGYGYAVLSFFFEA